jgi:hypothetical protein
LMPQRCSPKLTTTPSLPKLDNPAPLEAELAAQTPPLQKGNFLC